MPNQNDSDTPSPNAEEQPLPQAPATPTAPQERKMSKKANGNSDDEDNVSKELAKEFRWVEFAQIASNLILAVVGIIALCIYNGQLKQMRKSTKAAQDAAITANATLKEIQKGETDTHELAVQALSQATATNMLAREARISNDNSLEADRPWLGAVLTVQDFQVGKTPTFTVAGVNSGRRPAYVTLFANRSRYYETFPSDPQYVIDAPPSASLVLPGQNQIGMWKAKTEISEEEFRAMKTGVIKFFVHSKIEYTDSRTNRSYWTHACWWYKPEGISMQS
jgi:Flp pilus assembly protein TadG